MNPSSTYTRVLGPTVAFDERHRLGAWLLLAAGLTLVGAITPYFSTATTPGLPMLEVHWGLFFSDVCTMGSCEPYSIDAHVPTGKLQAVIQLVMLAYRAAAILAICVSAVVGVSMLMGGRARSTLVVVANGALLTFHMHVIHGWAVYAFVHLASQKASVIFLPGLSFLLLLGGAIMAMCVPFHRLEPRVGRQAVAAGASS